MISGVCLLSVNSTTEDLFMKVQTVFRSRGTLAAIIIGACGFLLAPAATTALGRNYYRNSPPRQNKTPEPDTVESVNVTANTITVKSNKESITYTVDKFTIVSVNGTTGKLEDLKKGMNVTVTESSHNRASKIEAQGDGQAPVEAKEKKRK
jgi:hypothetical protein